MIDNRNVSLTCVALICLWASTAALLAAAWIVGWSTDWSGTAYMLGLSGCALSAVAATAHVRSYAVQVCRLIRAASGLEVPAADAELHRIR